MPANPGENCTECGRYVPLPFPRETELARSTIETLKADKVALEAEVARLTADNPPQ